MVKVQALFPSTTNEALGNWALPTSSLRKLLTKPSSLSIESSYHFVQHSLCARQILTMVCAVTNSIPRQPYKGETTMIPIVKMRMLRLGDDRKFIQGPQLVRRRAKVCTRVVSFQTLHPPHDALLIYILRSTYRSNKTDLQTPIPCSVSTHGLCTCYSSPCRCPSASQLILHLSLRGQNTFFNALSVFAPHMALTVC